MKYFFNDRWVEALDGERGMSTHKQISFIKSGIRILGYIGGAAAFWDIKIAFYAFAVLIFSELVGIYEEVGEK